MLALAAALATSPAHATWSVVATDSATGEVGGAGTSCVGSLDVAIIFAGVPGVGAVHAQASINVAGRDRAAEVLAMGGTPADAIAQITAPSFDYSASVRQYGVVDVSGNAAGWTGVETGDWAGDVQGTDGTTTYSAQGNILTGPAVVDRTVAAFVDPAFCDLADKLMGGLEAGAAPGEGDSRCTPALPADSAFIRVLDAGGAAVLDLSVVNTSPDDPLVRLRADFDVWRASNPCPPADTGDTGDTATPGTETADTGSPGTPPTDPPDDPTDAGAPPTTDGGTDTSSVDPPATGGCGCAAGDPGLAGWGLVAALALVVGRRRREGATEAD